MAKKRISRKPGLFGYVYHYDESGKCIGKSRPSLMGDGKVHFDAAGKQVGTSRPGFFAKEVHHDKENERYISSYEGLAGDAHFSNGTPVGVSHPGFGGTEYATLDVADEFQEEDGWQALSTDSGNSQNSGIKYFLGFVACCLLIGIFVMILK